MNLVKLRKKHPRFVYESYSLNQVGKSLKLQYRFRLEPDAMFKPEVILPLGKEIDIEIMRNFAFHIGMIELVSYWKLACPPEVSIEAGRLSAGQITWWHNLFMHGLGEFFFRNDIDFTRPGFLSITNNYNGGLKSSVHESQSANGDLILVGGGKDSGLTLELLKKRRGRKAVLMLNPTRAALENAKITGYRNPIVVKRTIDPTLLKLNEKGYLNGHTPFSAYLAFLGVFMGALYDYKNIVVSNERSASEENTVFKGIKINHQYSKSYQFERLFRRYAKRYLSHSVQYFSFLRPLFDIQISRLFAQCGKLHFSFRSCNVNQKLDSWCGKCPKCAFIYLSLFPYLSQKQIERIFGNDYFLKPEIVKHVRDIVGLGRHKPFECVGTKEEAKLAIALSIRKYEKEKRAAPPLLLGLKRQLNITNQTPIKMLEDKLNSKWSNENFLPQEHAILLKNAVNS